MHESNALAPSETSPTSSIGSARTPAPAFELLRLEHPTEIGFAALPGQHEHREYVGHIYVFELSNGTIKVGLTTDPLKRLRQHARRARAYEIRIIKAWLSIAHMNPAETERMLIDYGRANCSGATGDEHFKGLDYASTVEFAKQIPYLAIDMAWIRADMARKWDEGAPVRAWVGATFDQPSPEPSPDLFDVARSHISVLFGRRSDGSYRVPRGFVSYPPGEMTERLQRLADLRECEFEDILDMSYLDLFEGLLKTMVEVEALRLHTYAIEHGLDHLIKPQGCYWEPE